MICDFFERVGFEKDAVRQSLCVFVFEFFFKVQTIGDFLIVDRVCDAALCENAFRAHIAHADFVDKTLAVFIDVNQTFSRPARRFNAVEHSGNGIVKRIELNVFHAD